MENEGEFTAATVIEYCLADQVLSCVLQSRRRSCCRRDGYWTKQSIGRAMRNVAAADETHTWVSGWAPVACPVGRGIDPLSSGWTLGLSEEHSDRLLTYGQVAGGGNVSLVDSLLLR